MSVHFLENKVSIIPLAMCYQKPKDEVDSTKAIDIKPQEKETTKKSIEAELAWLEAEYDAELLTKEGRGYIYYASLQKKKRIYKDVEEGRIPEPLIFLERGLQLDQAHRRITKHLKMINKEYRKNIK